MKLLENLSGENHLRACGMTEVTKLIVASHFAIALKRTMDSTSLLQEIISFFKFTFASNCVGWVMLSPDISF
jgi:hypothetical protein